MMRQRSQFVGLVALTALVVTSASLLGSIAPASAQTTLYKPCETYKLTAPISQSSATQAATLAATTAAVPATVAATTAATAPAMSATKAGTAAANRGDDIAFLSVVGTDSQACYVTTEVFLPNNMMGLPSGLNGAVGVTKTISGDIALDRTNVANSQIGDITINVSEFKSDSDQRDGYIRKRFLESNKFPYATLTNVTAIGLPTGAYQDGTTLTFQIKGTLTVHGTKRDTTFNATGALTGGTLVVTATTDLKMSDFGITVPNIGNLLTVDDTMRLVVNIVARTPQATPVATK